MRITILSHDLSSNAAMRAHRLALAARTFGDVRLIGPARRSGLWPALRDEPWIATVRKKRLPDFAASFLELVGMADGDVLIAVKPHLASFGAALVAGERRDVPVVLDVDDLDIALAPRSAWNDDPLMADVSRPASAVYVSLLTKAAPGAAAVIASSTALAERFGGTVVPHGSDTDLFDPERVDATAGRAAFGFDGPTVLFAGTPRQHKGVEELARAVAHVPGARLAVTCRPEDLVGPVWDELPVQRVPVLPYEELPALLSGADVVAIPQLESEAGRYQMPMKVFEAMAMAKPIVVTAMSDLPLVLHGCGVVVAPGDVDGLATAIARLLDDPAEAAEMGARARRRCMDRYSLQHVGAILERVIDQCLGRPGHGGAVPLS